MTETHLFIALYALTFARLVIYFQPSLISEPLKRRNVNEFIDSIVHAGVSALLLIHFIVRSYYIPSGSMIPTLLVKDYILVNELQYRFAKPARGDVAVFHPPDTYHGNKEDLIKRVVGIEGDLIAVKDGKLVRNGEVIDEPWIKEPIADDFPEYRVKKGCAFMMGDNRNDSFDSRFWHDVPLDHYVGKAEFIFFPFNRAGRIR
ncbi:signal peptidase I [bacterium]|nr:signal peptidase I [bacterium]